ncbi:phytoene/squalene synthase family protein [Salinarimonas ramus]|uniref:Phytoene synthase n=1 Tax=Salinarimonas ramus TaxID=690164 RepID=A0A917Q3W3_9HYPH|nr:phytoene/squalene synthase family protein [Salinarimonas ramus]GGK21700.1 phytoene synthase [Salinarimonas ramus]
MSARDRIEPGALAEHPSAQADLAACANLLRGGSRSFHAASRVLPRRVSEPAAALYAFCRVADDAVDLGHDRHAALALLRERLDRVYSGHPAPQAIDRAFAATVARYRIPRTLPEALLEGFAWDAQERTYETLSDVAAYAARVAGTVGAMMTLIMGRREPAVLARACDLGVAMQFTNIARDVGEDAANGRLYLPRQWLREAGIDVEAFLADPRPCPGLFVATKRLLAVADGLYARSMSGIAALPGDCRGGILAARALYAEIGHVALRRGPTRTLERAVVPRSRQIALVAGALARAPFLSGAADDTPPLPEVAFLVTAAARSGRAELPAQGLEERIAWLVDLFERLERRDAR